jgi:hypothetical protein
MSDSPDTGRKPGSKEPSEVNLVTSELEARFAARDETEHHDINRKRSLDQLDSQGLEGLFQDESESANKFPRTDEDTRSVRSFMSTESTRKIAQLEHQLSKLQEVIMNDRQDRSRHSVNNPSRSVSRSSSAVPSQDKFYTSRSRSSHMGPPDLHTRLSGRDRSSSVHRWALGPTSVASELSQAPSIPDQEVDPSLKDLLKGVANLCHSTLPNSQIAQPPAKDVPFKGNTLTQHGLGSSLQSAQGQCSLSHHQMQKEEVLAPLDTLAKDLTPFQYLSKKCVPLTKYFGSHGQQLVRHENLSKQEMNLFTCSAVEKEELFFHKRQIDLILALTEYQQHTQVLMSTFVEMMKGNSSIPKDLDELSRVISLQLLPQASLSARIYGNSVLREREILLRKSVFSDSTKEELRALPLFSDKLFPQDLKKLVKEKSSEAAKDSLTQQITKLAQCTSKIAQESGKQKQNQNSNAQGKNRNYTQPSRGRGGNFRGQTRGRGSRPSPSATAVRPTDQSYFQARASNPHQK